MAPLASMFLSTIINLPSEFLETIIGGIMNAYILACVSTYDIDSESVCQCV